MMDNGFQEVPKKSGCGKYLAIGCLGIVILSIIGGYIAYSQFNSFMGEVAKNYTAPEPAELPQVTVSKTEAKAVIDRATSFRKKLESGAAANPLTLSSQDINVLLQKTPEGEKFADKVHVTIKGDSIKGEISVPLSEVGDLFGGAFKGRYLNGTGVFRLAMAAGRLQLFLDSVSVKGEPMPEMVMKGLRAKNLAEKSNTNPEMAKALQYIENITIKDGKLIITPK